MTPELPKLTPPVRRFCASGGLFSLPPGPTLPVRLRGEPSPVLWRLLTRALPAEAQALLEPEGGPAFALGPAAPPYPEPPATHREAYTLRIAPGGISASAATQEGLFRAATTLAQLLEHPTLPCGEIEDAPARDIRGLMLDVSRNRIYALPTLFKVVDTLVQLKANRLELYFENVFAYRAHPTIWASTTPYTPAEMRALDQYCAERFITLAPNQNTLGHFERWFRADDTYRLRYAECPEGGIRTPWGSIQTTPTGLRTADPATTRFLEGLLDELLPCFPHAPVANLGGDEVFDLGKGRSQGAAPPAQLYLNHLSRMAAVSRRHGKTPELWADMLLRHPEILPAAREALPDATWALWGYEATDPLANQAERLAQAELPFIVSPGTSSWRSFCGRTDNMLANVRAAASLPSKGILLTDWGDSGHWQPLAIALPATTLALSLAWNTAAEPDLPQAIDTLVRTPGLGDFLLRLGNTYRTADALAPNATKLFQAYLLPPGQLPLAPDRLHATLAELQALEAEAPTLGQSLLAQEARYALGLQLLAVRRALGQPRLQRLRARLAAQMRLLWLKRGPVARLESSLRDFLAPELP